MVIERILNNNALISIDKFGREIVLLGNGIGYGKKKGDAVDAAKISSHYVDTRQYRKE